MQFLEVKCETPVEAAKAPKIRPFAQAHEFQEVEYCKDIVHDGKKPVGVYYLHKRLCKEWTFSTPEGLFLEGPTFRGRYVRKMNSITHLPEIS